MTTMNSQLMQMADDSRHVQLDAAPSLLGRASARAYDPLLWLGERRGMQARRAGLLRQARGEVLEIGAGTGLNLAHYPAAVEQLTLTEPVAEMAALLRRRVERVRCEALVVETPAERLPFADGAFDTVVSTMVLCTVEDPERALAEIRRVLRPDGQLLFVEHLCSDSERWGRWQDRLERPWAAFGAGCRCNRRTLATIEASGLTLDGVRHERWLGMPALVRPLAIGRAQP
jgi:SAM-dependent methyltransferase